MAADVRALTDRVESLIAACEPRATVDELVRTLVCVYGEGLARMMAALDGMPGGEETIQRWCADPFVASLLLIHDLHPVPFEQRLERALESVRPYLRSHGGDVEVTSVHDGIVELVMRGACDGCSASAQTLKRSIERAIFEAAPEVLEVRATAASVNADLLPRILA